MNYQIVDITKDEFPLLVPIWESSVRATHHFLKEADFQLFKTIVSSGIFGSVDVLKGVKDDNGQILGFLGTVGDSIEMLFIHADWRGKGIGRLLLDYALQALKATKVDVNEGNVQAIGFYELFGFRVVDRSELDGMGKPYPILHMRLL